MQKLLIPLSWVYGAVVKLRNHAYNRGWLKSQRGHIPTVVIGNIHIGGTGKTPHTLYLAQQLENFDPGILSRGYGRKTRGFRWVKSDAKASDVGDEPLLYKSRAPDIPVAVCENRVAGVEKMAASGRCRLVLLDDAFQHRKLTGDVNIALVRFDSLPSNEVYLPAGKLRDHRSRMKDADAVILTGLGDLNYPVSLRPDLRQRLCVKAETPIFKSCIVYGNLAASGRKAEKEIKRIILVTAIANAMPLKNYLEQSYNVVRHFEYRDHQAFNITKKKRWQEAVIHHKADAIITTMKDFMRMRHLTGIEELTIYIQPMRVKPENENQLIDWLVDKLKNTRPGEISER